MAKKEKHLNLKVNTLYLWIGIAVMVAFFLIVVGYSYCNQIIPKQVQQTYTEQEPYTVYESRTRTQTVAQDYCDEDSDCVCTDRYLGIFKTGCKECSCTITSEHPVTKYRNVEKTRIVTENIKRCSFIR